VLNFTFFNVSESHLMLLWDSSTTGCAPCTAWREGRWAPKRGSPNSSRHTSLGISPQGPLGFWARLRLESLAQDLTHRCGYLPEVQGAGRFRAREKPTQMQEPQGSQLAPFQRPSRVQRVGSSRGCWKAFLSHREIRSHGAPALQPHHRGFPALLCWQVARSQHR